VNIQTSAARRLNGLKQVRAVEVRKLKGLKNISCLKARQLNKLAATLSVKGVESAATARAAAQP
jgi:hypothetical protein